jgi:hypothetical protein
LTDGTQKANIIKKIVGLKMMKNILSLTEVQHSLVVALKMTMIICQVIIFAKIQATTKIVIVFKAEV